MTKFAHFQCPHYPCHITKTPFNCIFCYCPFYFLEICPGTPLYTKDKIKDCSECSYIHESENYEKIIKMLTVIIKQRKK